MIIKPDIDKRYKQIELHVCNEELNDEVKSVVRELHEIFDETIAAVDERGNRCKLAPSEIVSFYSEGQKVMALGSRGKYSVGMKLYELEEGLAKKTFVRISRSEIVNYRRIKSLDMSVTGTIKITMKNGYETYVSRRNIARIKELLVKDNPAL
ncbi:MAG: LytTR family transcriptional regulator [Eubacterium sp.]|nr:LytTR family transcriptional regulator [Eubacterium sp.]